MTFRSIVNTSATRLVLGAAFAVLVPAAFAQENETAETKVPNAAAETPAPAPQVSTPLIDDIHGIELGMTSSQVKDELGKPDVSDTATMFYDLDKGEQVHLKLDGDKKVIMVAGIYSGKGADAPEFAEVFGSGVEVPQQQEGKIYKLVRYPNSGYWVAYGRIDLGHGPMTTVTIQKIER